MADTLKPRLRIALIAEQQSHYIKLGYAPEECAALTHDGEVHAVATTLQQLGHQVTLVPGVQPLVEQLAAGKHRDWDLAFNMAQGFHGKTRESQVPSLLDAYQVPYTFSDAETMALCQNKAYAKMILNHYNIPNAPFMVITGDRFTVPRHTTLLQNYPLFIKPATEGSSKGIDGYNKADSSADLNLAIQKVKARFPGQDILVESFLSGREFTVSILGTGSLGRVIGIREHLWQSQSPPDHTQNGNGNGNGNGAKQNFACWKSKSSNGCLLQYEDSHDMEDPHVKAACQVALDTWTVFGCRDAGRVDIRFDSDDEGAIPHVLEVNPIAGMLPGHSPLPESAKVNGISFETLMGAIIDSAMSREFQD